MMRELIYLEVGIAQFHIVSVDGIIIEGPPSYANYIGKTLSDFLSFLFINYPDTTIINRIMV